VLTTLFLVDVNILGLTIYEEAFQFWCTFSVV